MKKTVKMLQKDRSFVIFAAALFPSFIQKITEKIIERTDPFAAVNTLLYIGKSKGKTHPPAL